MIKQSFEEEAKDVDSDESQNQENVRLPADNDPIYKLGPDDPVITKWNLWVTESIPPIDEEQRKMLKSFRKPRTILPLNHEDPWDEWKNLAKDPATVQKLWEEIFGKDVPAMTAYELRAIIKNVNCRLLYHWEGLE